MVQATAHRQTSVRAGFATATRTETEYNLVVIVNDEPPSSTALRDGATLQTVNYLDWQETEPHAWVFFFFSCCLPTTVPVSVPSYPSQRRRPNMRGEIPLRNVFRGASPSAKKGNRSESEKANQKETSSVNLDYKPTTNQTHLPLMPDISNPCFD